MKNDTKHRAISRMAVEHSHWKGGMAVKCLCDSCSKEWYEICVCSYHNNDAKKFIETLKSIPKSGKGLSFDMVMRAIKGEFGAEIKQIAKTNYKQAFIDRLNHKI